MMSTDPNPALSTFTVSVSTTDQEHDVIAPPSPSQMVLPGMEPTVEDALAIEPVTAHDEVLTDEDPEVLEEAAFEPIDLDVEDIVEAVETADVDSPSESEPKGVSPRADSQADMVPAVTPDGGTTSPLSPASGATTSEDTTAGERVRVRG